jgi:TPR repeat protein
MALDDTDPRGALGNARDLAAHAEKWVYRRGTARADCGGAEGIRKPNLVEAYKLFRQAGDLGFSDALIRVGVLQEHGKGTARNSNAAVRSYIAAAKAGNFFGLAYLAKLLSRSSHLEKAADVWSCFFSALADNPEPRFVASTRGELLHSYTDTQLGLGNRPFADIRRKVSNHASHLGSRTCFGKWSGRNQPQTN